MRKAYIAGPITGKSYEHIVKSFSSAADLAHQVGFLAISPIEMDITFDGHINEEPTPEDKRKFARRDTHVLINEMKAENGDVIVMLEGWENSKGAKAEHSLAVWVGLRVLTEEDLEDATE